MVLRPPGTTRTDPLFPSTALCRSQNLTLEDPDLDAANAISGVGFGFGIVDVRAQRVQRNAAFAIPFHAGDLRAAQTRSEEHTSELQSLMRSSYAALC